MFSSAFVSMALCGAALSDMKSSCLGLLFIAALTSTMMAKGEALYRINGILAPQVRYQPLAKELENELSALRRQIEVRSKAVNLAQALEAGLLNNPLLAAAYAEIQGQQWSAIAARRQWYPTISVGSASGLPSHLPTQNFSDTSEVDSYPAVDVVTRSSVSTRDSEGNLALTLGWTFFDPSRGATINSAEESLKRQRLLFDVSARNLALEIQLAYFNLQEQKQLIKSYDEILQITDRQVRIAEAKFNNGLVSIADVEQIRTQQFATVSAQIDAFRKYIDAASRLAETMALPPGNLVLPSDDLSANGRWDESLEKTIEQALRLREEIQASLAAAESASWSATSLFNTYWPRFSLGASTQYFYTNSDITSSTQGEVSTLNRRRSSWNGAVGIGFTWQLFDGGINAAEGEIQKAISRQARDQAAQDRLSVTKEVEQSFSAYLTGLRGLRSTEAQVKSARAAADAVQERFQVGVTDMSSLIVALNEAIRAANDYASSIRIYNSSVASLYRSSARWPIGTRLLLETRINTLRQR